MANDSLVSVIVPIYNVEKYLRRCVESILSQSYKKMEIILVDDGSEDGSSQICDYYEEIDERIHVVHKENGGLSDARNAGIDICKGEYLLFIDSDDYIRSDMVEGMLEVAIKEEADIVECGVLYEDEDSPKRSGKRKKTELRKSFDHEQAVTNILDYKSRIMAWGKLYRANLFKSIRFPYGKLHEDEFIVPFVVDLCSKYVYMDKQSYIYVQRKGSITNSAFNTKRLDILDAHEKRLAFFSDKYNGKYNIIIKYHFFVSCAFLKMAMGKQYGGSKTEEIYGQLFRELKCSGGLRLKKKVMLYIYRWAPKTAFSLIK